MRREATFLLCPLPPPIGEIYLNNWWTVIKFERPQMRVAEPNKKNPFAKLYPDPGEGGGDNILPQLTGNLQKVF